MIEFKDVSTDNLLEYLKYCSKTKDEKRLYLILNKLGIRNYEELEELFNSTSLLKERIESLSERLMESNKKGIEPNIFTFDKTKKAHIDSRTRYITDKGNKGNVLLFSSPVRVGGDKDRYFRDMSMFDLKYLLTHVDDKNLSNVFINNAKGFGEYNTGRLITAIDFYDRQVIRQAWDVGYYGLSRNLFLINDKEKEKIVREYFDSMAIYLAEHADECVWGELTSHDKERIIKAANLNNKSNNETIIVYKKLLDTFTNYMTLSELSDDKKRNKAIRRLIVK